MVSESVRDTPRADPAWTASIVLVLIGLVDSIYLSWVKLANSTASCAGIGDCETVNNSRFAVV